MATTPRLESVTAAPQAALRPLVTSYLGYHLRTPPGSHRGLPSRNVTFIVSLEGTVDLAGHGSFPTLVAGLHAEPVRIDHDGLQHGIQVGLTPPGARMLLGLPAGELAGTTVELSDLLGRATAGELVERVRSAGTWAGRFAELDAGLARLAELRSASSSALSSASASAELGWAWRRLAESGGAVEVGALAAEVGWSRQHLRARFQREYGLSPKLAGQIMRFEGARELLVRPEPARPALSEIAVWCGYADQAHFNRDWLRFAGATPSTWLAEEFPFVQDSVEVVAAS